jgi:hypothetical protein
MATIPNEEKVFMVSNSTNTTYSGSASLKAMQEWYTMQDVTDTVRPYQVFTALLTQEGGDGPLTINSGTLRIGTTYTIQNVGRENFDFTNVGAPNNDPGTSFIATGEVPNSWGTGGDPIDLIEYNTGAPTAIVLENTIGNVWFTYALPGKYRIDNSEDLFTIGKVWGVAGPQDPFEGYYCSVEPGAADEVTIGTSINGEASNDVIYEIPIEIRVYN